MKLIKSLRAVSSRSLGLLALFVAVSASRCIASPLTVIPPGLAAGSQYRLILVTADGYLATSTNIATYNSESTQRPTR